MNHDDGELIELLADLGRVVDSRGVGGGCISQAARVHLLDSRGDEQVVLVKRNDASFLDNFRCEAEGLRRLGAVGAIAVAQPLKVAVVGRQAWLVTSWIETDSPRTAEERAAFFNAFGRQLAELHRGTRGHRIGLENDNFLGSARQINTPTSSWSEFVQTHRLGFQIRWAVDQRLADGPLQRGLEQVVGDLPQLLAGRDDETVLLHGDLWSGNYLCDVGGQPVLIDPAISFGCREAEFGMLMLFGGCPQRFYDAYQTAWPLPAGWQRRTRIYVLYHLLNHLNLFGTGYRERCRAEVANILQENAAR